MKILLACSMGLSTSMLIEKLKEEGKKRGMDLDVDAVTYQIVNQYVDTTDILLLGPQIRYLVKKFQDDYGDRIPVIDAMNMSDYALLNAEKILNEALAKYQDATK